VSGKQAIGNEVIIEEITLHETTPHVEDEYLKELSETMMEMRIFIDERLKGTNIKVNRIELDLDNLPKQLIYIDLMSEDYKNNTQEKVEIVDDIVQSAIAESIMSDDSPYRIIVNEFASHDNNEEKSNTTDLEKATMELAQYIQSGIKDENIILHSIGYDLKNLPKRFININVRTSEIKENSKALETIDELVQSAIKESIIQENEPYEIVVQRK
jgi:hemerythrin